MSFIRQVFMKIKRCFQLTLRTISTNGANCITNHRTPPIIPKMQLFQALHEQNPSKRLAMIMRLLLEIFIGK